MKLAKIFLVAVSVFTCCLPMAFAQTSPFATTEPAILVTGTNATLTGMVTPNGLPTTCKFQWGINGHYGLETPAIAVGSGGGAIWATNQIAGLLPGQIYHFRVVASNSVGVAYGADRIFGVGKIVVWGDIQSGQINVPTDLSNAVAIAAGYYECLALKTDSSVTGWGPHAGVPAGLMNMAAIAAFGGVGGVAASAALKNDGTAVCWGSIGSPSSNPTNGVVVTAGNGNDLVIKNDGNVVVWGNTDYGQITQIPANLTNVVAVASGDLFCLAVKANGTIIGWGYGGYGTTNIPTGLSNVVAIASGAANALALKSDGTLVGWGDNTYGETNIAAGISNVVAIATGNGYDLALKNDGNLVGWGYNTGGQTNIPAGLSNVVAIAAGYNFAMALVATNYSPTPVITVPSNLTVQATGPAGAPVSFTTSATDAVFGVVAAIATPPSGSTFPVGTNIVTVTATNAAGYGTSQTFKVIVVAVPPSALSYLVYSPVYTKGIAINPNTPSSSGGAVVSYSVSPALPAGLILDTNTGVISGTPTVVTVSANYTVTASNAGGATTAYLTITVNDVAATQLTYQQNPASYTKGITIIPNLPSHNGGLVVYYTISPALPAGLTLDSTTGVISGTPTVVTASANYTVAAVNSGGQTTASVNITVNDAPPTLNIASTGNQTALYWPASGTNYILQSTTDLAASNWVSATDAIPVIAFTVTNTPPARYFRLQKSP